MANKFQQTSFACKIQTVNSVNESLKLCKLNEMLKLYCDKLDEIALVPYGTREER